MENEQATEKEQVQEQEQVEQVAEQTEQTETTEQTQEESTENQETEQTETEETQEQAVEEPKKFNIKRKGEEIELTEQEMIENAQKGFDYTKKMQAQAEIEKALEAQKAQYANITNNPNVVKMMLAEQAHIDPKYIFTDIPQPHPSLQEIDPAAYVAQLTDYQLSVKAKKMVDDTFAVMQQQQAALQNTAIINKAKLKYEDLPESDFNNMVQWASQRFQPVNGVYPQDSLDIAYKHLYGDKKTEDKLLSVSNKIQKTIKEAGKTKGIQTQRQKVTSQEKSSESEFLNYVSGKK